MGCSLQMDRKSISSFIIMLDQGAVSWGSKKQTSVALSMVEAKFVATLTAIRKILWHRSDTLRQNLDISVTMKRLEIFLEYMWL